MEIQHKNYQEAQLKDSEERSRHIIPVSEESRTTAAENALMIRPIADPLQVLANR